MIISLQVFIVLSSNSVSLDTYLRLCCPRFHKGKADESEHCRRGENLGKETERDSAPGLLLLHLHHWCCCRVPFRGADLALGLGLGYDGGDVKF